VVRGYLKPISTLRRPLGSVSFETREPVKAAYERSDVCVVPAAGVAAEAMVALTWRGWWWRSLAGTRCGDAAEFQWLLRADSSVKSFDSAARWR
jgi:chorismate synthase